MSHRTRPIESISIISVLGSSIRSYRNIQSNDQIISLDGIDSGIYFLEVQTSDEQKQIRRFVKSSLSLEF